MSVFSFSLMLAVFVTGNAYDKKWAAFSIKLFKAGMVFCFIINTCLAQVPRPADVFGFEPGADYKIAGWKQLLDYYTRLDKASERVKMVEIGKSVQGRPLLLLFISSEENLKQLDLWRTISEKLSRAKIGEPEARQLAACGKAIVWVDAGLHASEKAPAQMASELAYKLATLETPEVKKIRDEVVTLLMPVMNPDGLDIVADWYRAQLGTPYETTNPPWLYHVYAGHDNNRDWFMNNLPETRAVTRVLYHQWYPQVVYNHHQSAPSWTRIFLPPFASPLNPNIHPGITTAVNLLGSAMANRLALKKMPGVISQFTYDMWWNGGMRSVPYFHNQIGLLTEVAHPSPTPKTYPKDSLPSVIGSSVTMPTNGTDVFYPYPWKGGVSHFRDAVDYTLETSFAVLQMASLQREQYLYNIYRMGRDAIETPDSLFAYVISATQWDRGEAINLVNILRMGGVEVQQALSGFKADSASYPAGSFVIYAAQAFRPYMVDLLERQLYPDRRLYKDGPPLRPYDLTGWTLPLQMGVKVDRIASAFSVNVKEISEMAVPAPGKTVQGAKFGYLLSPNGNGTFKVINQFLKEGIRVERAGAGFNEGDHQYPAGSFIIRSKTGIYDRLKQAAVKTGLDFISLNSKPSVRLKEINPVRVAIYKSWVANMDEGWTRWLLENYSFNLDTLHDQDIIKKDLSVYHAIIIPDQPASSILNGHRKGAMPEMYTGGIGKNGVAALEKYISRGGRLVTLDGASDFAIQQFDLPLKNVVAGVSREKFYIPGSLIRMRINQKSGFTWGMQEEVSASFNNSRAFELKQGVSEGPGSAEVVASYAPDSLLMSGWALGDRIIAGKPSVVNIKKGKGNIYLFAFSPQFRGQSHATYKLLFNALIN